MVTRHNACTNPALTVNATGWGGASVPVRADVTAETFGRQFAARYTTGSFAQTPVGAVTGAQTYTLSAFVRPDGAASGGNACYIEWKNAAGSASYTSGAYSWTGSAITRATITGAAPADAVTASLITDIPGGRTVDVTMALIEQVGAADTYFDGATPGATWDGTAGNSASTLGGAPAFSDPLAFPAGVGVAAAGAKAATGAVVLPVNARLAAAGVKAAQGASRLPAGLVFYPLGVKAAVGAPRLPAGAALAPAKPSSTRTVVVQYGDLQLRWTFGDLTTRWSFTLLP